MLPIHIVYLEMFDCYNPYIGAVENQHPDQDKSVSTGKMLNLNIRVQIISKRIFFE